MRMTLDEAVKCCIDRNNYPAFFKIDVGRNFHLETKPDYYCEINDFRNVKIEITSFRGVSCGAQHYYAKIIADGIKIFSYEKGTGGKVRKVYHGGYVCDEYSKLLKNNPLWDLFYEIEVCRPLTQQEIDEDPERWEYYDAGQLTNAFYTKEEAIKQAKDIIKARFDVDWIIKIDDLT